MNESNIYNVPEPVLDNSGVETGAYISSYSGANPSRLRKSHAWGRSIVGTEESALPQYARTNVVQEGRDLVRNFALVAGVTERFAEYVVHTGLQPTPTTSNPDWNRKAAAFWQNWAENCDHEGLADLRDMQRLAVRERVIAGESLILPLASGQTQQIEGEQIRTPAKFAADQNVKHGLRLKKGVVVGIYICHRTDGGSIDLQKYDYRELKKGAWRQWVKKRPAQMRGVPEIAPLLESVRDYEETMEAFRAKVKMDGSIALQSVSSKQQPAPAANLGTIGARTTETDDAGNTVALIKTKVGTVVDNPEGRELKDYYSRSPAANVMEFLKNNREEFSACLNIPYSFLMMIFDGSYSASRANMLHANHTFDGWNDWLQKTMMRPLWRWRIAKAIHDGDLPPAPIDPDTGKSEWCKVNWSVPFKPEIDIQKTALADQTNVQTGVTTITSICRDRNQDRSTLWKEMGEEFQQAAQICIAHNKQFPDNPEMHIKISDITNSATPGSVVADTTSTKPNNEDD